MCTTAILLTQLVCCTAYRHNAFCWTLNGQNSSGCTLLTLFCCCCRSDAVLQVGHAAVTASLLLRMLQLS